MVGKDAQASDYSFARLALLQSLACETLRCQSLLLYAVLYAVHDPDGIQAFHAVNVTE